VQLLVPIVIAWSWVSLGTLEPRGRIYLANAGLMWLPFIGISIFGAARYMDNLSSARSNLRRQLVILRSKHTWLMAWLYIGTFGSFIGYSAAFPLLLKTQFPEHARNLAFIGPLVGSIARPLGGRLADALGGARVTLWTFVAMGLATLAVIHFVDVHGFAGFLLTFLFLFVTTGAGNGSTYRMIPAIFRNEKLAQAEGRGPEVVEAALKEARIEGAAVLGFVSAVGACGGYLVPRAFAASIAKTGSAHAALIAFLVFYSTCIAVTWVFYARPKLLSFRVASVEARV
jgi:NNP family nitrate/nitrite transporter-like MFS transporter